MIFFCTIREIHENNFNPPHDTCRAPLLNLYNDFLRGHYTMIRKLKKHLSQIKKLRKKTASDDNASFARNGFVHCVSYAAAILSVCLLFLTNTAMIPPTIPAIIQGTIQVNPALAKGIEDTK